MKVERVEKFQPIVITLESQVDANTFAMLIDFAFSNPQLPDGAAELGRELLAEMKAWQI